MNLLLLEDTLPIIKAISDRYAKVLGESHYISLANKEYCEEIKKRINGFKDWEDLCNEVEINVNDDESDDRRGSVVGNLGRRLSQVFTGRIDPRASFSGSIHSRQTRPSMSQSTSDSKRF